jgi:hypothetical protein
MEYRSIKTSYPPGLRFPTAHFENFLCQFVPRWGSNNAATQRAYDALLQRLRGGVLLLTHSQGGNFGLTAALHAPDRVRAVISLEPSGAPDPTHQDARSLKDVPHLFLWGDYLDRHSFWVESRPASEKWRDALQRAGCDVTWTELPALGIGGNTHALMSDDNSDVIASLVLDWIGKHV